MSENATSNFPAMGESIIGTVVNVSGKASPYTKPVVSKNTKAAEPTGVGSGKANKGKSVIQHANGPSHTIVAKICYPNAEGSGKTMRNIRRVRGGQGFYGARAAQGNTGNV